MKLDAPQTKRRARIEMIPLIDCVFIVLVFFIYSMLAMTMQKGIDVQLPAAAGVQADVSLHVVITVTGQGDFLFNDDRVTMSELRNRVRAISGQDDLRVFVNGDEGARHGWIMRIVDELRDAGVGEVTMLTRERDS